MTKAEKIQHYKQLKEELETLTGKKVMLVEVKLDESKEYKINPKGQQLIKQWEETEYLLHKLVAQGKPFFNGLRGLSDKLLDQGTDLLAMAILLHKLQYKYKTKPIPGKELKHTADLYKFVVEAK